MKKFYFISLVLLTALMIFIMAMAGCILCFIDLPSLIVVVLITFIMLLAGFSPAEMGRCFKAAFENSSADKAGLEEALTFFRTMQKYLILAGLSGMMIGLIAMLAMLDDPDRIGSGMALALVTVLYAVYFSLAVAIPFRTAIEKKLGSR